MLPDDIAHNIKDHINSGLSDFNPVHGGDINEGARLTDEKGKKYFIKWNTNTDPDMFEKEAKGLKLLNEGGSGIKIPNVLGYGDTYLLMEWLDEETGGSQSSYDFGVKLARLHRNSSDAFGLDHNNYIGKLPQSNTPHSNWADFFALQRIEPQIQMAIESGNIDRSLFKTVQKLYSNLGRIFPKEKPALLHGDLWSGNYMFLNNGTVSIYDPAVYYGHREMDIGMTRLFGGFSEDFYRGYEDEYPLESGSEERTKLSNLYPILVHANLFGGSYSRQAEQIIRRYA